jgi:hypothetical protein
MYNWKIYNKKKTKISIKFEEYNNLNEFNLSEKSYYNHTRDLLALNLINIGNSKLNVLDYGSNILSISNLKNKISLSKVNFFIYDPFYNEKFKNLPILKFINYKIFNNINLLKKKIDLLNLGSSLQYLDNYNIIFDQVDFNKNSKILITATPFTTQKKYKSKQINHLNLNQNINNFKKLIIDFKKKNFQLVFKSSINIKLASIKNLKKKTFFLNLLFKKT